LAGLRGCSQVQQWQGDLIRRSFYPPFLKGGRGDFQCSHSIGNSRDAEFKLWQNIREKRIRGYQFYRQKNIGNYIVDFYCPKGKLIIELDGGQHYSEEGMESDGIRDNYLAGLGFTVLRFSDRDVLKNMDGVLQRIYEHF
jgi:very-short-patch-repair endonuclease